MAITGIDYMFWKELRHEDKLPVEPFVLELGQANWFGDRHPECLIGDVYEYAKAGDIERLLARLKEPGTPQEPIEFIQAEVFYRSVVGAASISSIDMNGTTSARYMDLNLPIGYECQDIVVNSGTAEHIFNQHQFFQTCHDACRPGGLIVHMLPAWGWLDHGFYNYHPTFISDLAAANDYEIVKWWLYDYAALWRATIDPDHYIEAYAECFKKGGSTLQAVCCRKTADSEFTNPPQGYYSRKAPAKLRTPGWDFREVN